MDSFNKFGRRRNLHYVCLGICVGCFGLLLALFYRPFIYENNIKDFHFADTLGSLFCVPSSAFISYGLHKKSNFFRLLIFNTIFWVIYEIPSSIADSIDSYDYLAIIISSLLTWLSFKCFLKERIAN